MAQLEDQRLCYSVVKSCGGNKAQLQQTKNYAFLHQDTVPWRGGATSSQLIFIFIARSLQRFAVSHATKRQKQRTKNGIKVGYTEQFLLPSFGVLGFGWIIFSSPGQTPRARVGVGVAVQRWPATPTWSFGGGVGDASAPSELRKPSSTVVVDDTPD